MIQAVLDRIEDGYAVFVRQDDEDDILMPVDDLPDGIGEGDHVRLEQENGEVIAVTMDEQATEAAQERIQEKLKRLRRGDHLSSEQETQDNE